MSVARVADSEEALLRVARALVAPAGSRLGVESLLREARPLPPRIGPTAMRLLEDTLGRGAVLSLARRGGWQKAAHLDGTGGVREGRLWQRHASPAPLALTAASMELLRWLVRAPLESPACPPLSSVPATVGDELLVYLACDAALELGCAGPLARSPMARESALAWLAFPSLLGEAGAPRAEVLKAGFARLVRGGGVPVVEALAPELERRWLGMERAKGRLGVAAMLRLGAAQDAVLEAWLDALDGDGGALEGTRRDLADFVVRAGAATLRRAVERRPSPSPSPSTSTAVAGRLTRTVDEDAGPLSDRQEARVAAGALLRAVARVGRWDDSHRTVRFIDDGYDIAQRLLARWEPFAPSLRAADSVLRGLAAPPRSALDSSRATDDTDSAVSPTKAPPPPGA